MAPEKPPGTPSSTLTRSSIPTRLVGTWVTFDSGNAKQMYVFSADGLYTFVGLLQQQRPSGMFSFSITAEGTAAANKSRLILQPARGMKSMRDPDSPSSNYDRPIGMSPESYEWDVSGDVLSLTDKTGLTVRYAAE